MPSLHCNCWFMPMQLWTIPRESVLRFQVWKVWTHISSATIFSFLFLLFFFKVTPSSKLPSCLCAASLSWGVQRGFLARRMYVEWFANFNRKKILFFLFLSKHVFAFRWLAMHRLTSCFLLRVYQPYTPLHMYRLQPNSIYCLSPNQLQRLPLLVAEVVAEVQMTTTTPTRRRQQPLP